MFGKNRAYSCTFLRFFHVGLQNDNLDFFSYKISSRIRSTDISHVIDVYRYELMHLLLALQTKGRKSIFEDYFCVYFDAIQDDECWKMFYRTLNARIENRGFQQYPYVYDPPSVS